MTAIEGLGQLAARVTGPVLRPGDAGYDRERSGFNSAATRRPDVIVGARSAEDVRLAVTFAADHGLPAGVLAAGHGPGAAVMDGGVLVSTRRMDGVSVDPGARTARVAAGARFVALLAAAAPYGLAPLNGSSPELTVVPYVLGGGLSLLPRSHGIAADQVRSMRVVTADGRLRRVTPADTELFWALLGARDNFGIVTELELALAPLTTLYGGGLYFDAVASPRVLEAWRQWTLTVPDSMNSSIALLRMPDLPGVPGPLRGRSVYHVRIAFTGPLDEGAGLVGELRAVAEPLLEWAEEIPYQENGRIHDEPSAPMPWLGDGALLGKLPEEAVLRLLAAAGAGAESAPVLELRHLGGAFGRRPARRNAVGHRAAHYLLGVLHPLHDGAAREPAAEQRRILGEVEPWRLGRFPGLLGHGAGPEEVRSAYEPGDYQRLRRLKAQWDPADTFRLNHHIPPAGD